MALVILRRNEASKALHSFRAGAVMRKVDLQRDPFTPRGCGASLGLWRPSYPRTSFASTGVSNAIFCGVNIRAEET